MKNIEPTDSREQETTFNNQSPRLQRPNSLMKRNILKPYCTPQMLGTHQRLALSEFSLDPDPQLDSQWWNSPIVPSSFVQPGHCNLVDSAKSGPLQVP